MADIHVEKRNPVWPWILGLVVLALLIWALMAGRGEDRTAVTTGDTTSPALTTVPETTPPATTPAVPPPAATTAAAPGTTADEIPVAVIVEQPAMYDDQTVTGTAVVAAVEPDRGVWIEQEGQRLLVVVTDPQGQADGADAAIVNLQPGQTVRLTGIVQEAGPDTGATGTGTATTDAGQQQAAQDEQVYLSVVATDIEPADDAGNW